MFKTPVDSPKSYIVEVDLDFPQILHDSFEECPPCLESLTPKMDWFSEFQKEIGTKSGKIRYDKYHGSDKLVQHLHKHEK